MSVIGIDTSNYTTSIAFWDGTTGENCSKLLPVKPGELGLRQSDAVFAHIKSLPDVCGKASSIGTDHTDPLNIFTYCRTAAAQNTFTVIADHMCCRSIHHRLRHFALIFVLIINLKLPAKLL